MKMNSKSTPINLKDNSGFSLIELMIVVAIIGIIAAVGYPSYSGYVTKTKRADGTFGLLSAVQSMERCKSTKYSYAACTLPGSLGQSPEKYYTITLDPAPTASTFTIVATPAGTQTSDKECTSMSINHLGSQTSTSTPAGTGDDPNGCWN